MKSFSLIAFSAILGCMALSSMVDAQSKTCNLKEFDMCLTNFYYDQKGIPGNEKALRKTCTSTRTLSKCLHTYFHRCSSPAFRETFLIIVNSIMNPFLDICGKPNGDDSRTDIFKHSKCLNANSKKIGTCAEDNKNTIFYLLESSYEKRVPILCCGLRKVSECTNKKIVDLCGQDHADFQKNYYQASGLLQEICGHYDPNGPSCKDYQVPDGWKTSEDPKAPLSRMINAFF